MREREKEKSGRETDIETHKKERRKKSEAIGIKSLDLNPRVGYFFFSP